MIRAEKHTFSTRDWLMMSALAALGGVTGTYVNAIGDFMQSILGFAGTTQWAAGLHVVWLTLAMGLTGRIGAGTLTGLLKGAVELLTGNTHGLLVVLIDLVAGLLVDAVFLFFRRKDRLPAYLLAGGLASASNVFVFQLFAALPADMLAYGALLLVGGLAAVSGVVFAGLLGWVLLGALHRAGVVRNQPAPVQRTRMAPILLSCAAVLTVLFGVYLRGSLAGPTTVSIGGAVSAPYAYPQANADIAQVTAEGTLRGVASRYTGVPVLELLNRANPLPNAGLLLVRAVDGYAFFVSIDEVRDNPALLLAPKGSGSDAAYDLVGAENSKAWVRGVSELTVIGDTTLEVRGALGAPGVYDPDAWQFEMDSVELDVGRGPEKLQGAPLGRVLASMSPAADATEVLIETPEGSPSLPIADVLGEDDVRIFTIIGEDAITFAVAWMDGTVVAPQVTALEVQ
ncbi:MAG: ECF transporter S component [Anaerolineae bacterium]|nr:ECF transporter S component [Anaerolineae bacterium]